MWHAIVSPKSRKWPRCGGNRFKAFHCYLPSTINCWQLYHSASWQSYFFSWLLLKQLNSSRKNSDFLSCKVKLCGASRVLLPSEASGPPHINEWMHLLLIKPGCWTWWFGKSLKVQSCRYLCRNQPHQVQLPHFPENKPYPKNKPQLSETLPSTIVQQSEEDDMTVSE